MMASICLYVSVPVCSFRGPYARTFAETLPVPPPATVFGMLLSLVGERERERHAGAELAIALMTQPAQSTVLRKMWRVKTVNIAPGTGNNATPDYQDLLTGLEFLVTVRPGEDIGRPSLAERLTNAFAAPEKIDRFGSLCLGESTHLVNDVRPVRNEDLREIRKLLPRSSGALSLPLWPDHVGSFRTVWQQYDLAGPTAYTEASDIEFVRIAPHKP